MNTTYSREAVDRCKTPKSLGNLNYTARLRAETYMERADTAAAAGDTAAAQRMADIAAEHRDIAKASLARIEKLAAQQQSGWSDAVQYATANTAAAELYATNASEFAAA